MCLGQINPVCYSERTARIKFHIIQNNKVGIKKWLFEKTATEVPYTRELFWVYFLFVAAFGAQ